MNRSKDCLIPLELGILSAALELRRDRVSEFYGFLIAKRLQDQVDAKSLTAHGTLYKALGRLEDAKLLTSRWEDPAVAARARRPVRQLYKMTSAGQAALAAAARTVAADGGRTSKRQLAPA